jgi:ATP-dependent DNA ligase
MTTPSATRGSSRRRWKLKRSRFVLDGEAVVLNLHGISDFDALHSGKHNDEVQFYAFDMLADDGDDIRRLRLWA